MHVTGIDHIMSLHRVPRSNVLNEHRKAKTESLKGLQYLDVVLKRVINSLK